MRTKITNTLSIEVSGVELTQASKLEFYVRQDARFYQYTPTVIDDTHLTVQIPKEDAMRLLPNKPVRLQLALTDGDGNPIATDIVQMTVQELLKETGYGD